jgi:hypothetical protein
LINHTNLQRISIVLLLLLLALLPFFEGGETSLGLFLIHSLTILLLCIFIFLYQRISIPHFLPYFLPFLLSSFVSALVAPYKYSAFLLLWDQIAAGLFAVAIFSIFMENKEHLNWLTFYAFLITSVEILVSVLFNNFSSRIRGSFVNPNDFATFTLLLIILGLFQFEHQTENRRKILIATLLIFLGISMALASSRSVFVAGSIFFLLYAWKKKPGNALAIGMTLIILFSSAFIFIRFQSFHDPWRYYRFKIWRHSLEAVLEDPYLGVGLNMLPYKAAKYNFPSDNELGRYARVAKSADNQYFQILAETGFLGLFTFLIGWAALYFALARLPNRFLQFRYSYLIISIICFFSLSLNNTAILFLFLFLVVFPILIDPGARPITISLNAPARIVAMISLFILFAFFVYLPYVADREFKAAFKSNDATLVQEHLENARLYNPFQPYYQFTLVSRIVDSKPELSVQKWLQLVSYLNDSIRLNRLEPDFYTYKAKIYRRLFELSGSQAYFTETVSNYQAAIDRSPYNVFLRTEYAYFLIWNGRVESATTELSKIISLEPAYLNARYLLAETKFKSGDVAGAQKELTEADNYYERYKTYTPGKNEGYIKALLRINPEKREEIRRLILNAS